MNKPFKAGNRQEAGLYTIVINAEHAGLISYIPEGFGHYGHTLNPELSFSSKQEAEIAAIIANRSYDAGYKQAMEDVRKLIGVDR